jgi:hypothetical protein
MKERALDEDMLLEGQVSDGEDAKTAEVGFADLDGSVGEEDLSAGRLIERLLRQLDLDVDETDGCTDPAYVLAVVLVF